MVSRDSPIFSPEFSTFVVHARSLRKRKKRGPAKEVKCNSVCFSHVPQLPQGQFIRHVSSILTENEFQICWREPAMLF